MNGPLTCVDCDATRLYARGRCNKCYLRHRKALKASGEFKPLLTIGKPLERLMSKTKPGLDGCVLYTGRPTNRGYGEISVNGARMLIHRAAYTLIVGPIPDGMDLDHACHNRDDACLGGVSCPHRRCVNVEHLEPVTGAENARRAQLRIHRFIQMRCPSGHRFDPENTIVHDGRRYCRACAERMAHS